MLRRALLALLLLPVPARAEPMQLSFAAYAGGLNVLNMDASFDLSPQRYRIRLAYRTAGTVGLFLRAQQETSVDGQFVAGRAAPQRLYSAGVLRGEARVTSMEYVAGQPVLRQLVPPAEQEREPVPPEQQRGTIDTLSAMAQLVRQVNETGRCEGSATTFDGRRLSTISARTAGPEFLPPGGMTSFSGNALRCDFEGRQLAGFLLDEDRERLRRPQRGSAWFAAVTPGGKLVPVRISFHTRWFGDATMFLTDRRA